MWLSRDICLHRSREASRLCALARLGGDAEARSQRAFSRSRQTNARVYPHSGHDQFWLSVVAVPQKEDGKVRLFHCSIAPIRCFRCGRKFPRVEGSRNLGQGMRPNFRPGPLNAADRGTEGKIRGCAASTRATCSRSNFTASTPPWSRVPN